MKDQFEISFDKKGLTQKEKLYPIFKVWAFVNGKPTTKVRTIAWENVQEVYVFKRDIFAIDLICLAFRLNNDESLELNEQMKSWKYLVENLPKYLPDCPTFEQWFMDVAFPAFELNLIKIYPRENL